MKTIFVTWGKYLLLYSLYHWISGRWTWPGQWLWMQHFSVRNADVRRASLQSPALGNNHRSYLSVSHPCSQTRTLQSLHSQRDSSTCERSRLKRKLEHFWNLSDWRNHILVKAPTVVRKSLETSQLFPKYRRVMYSRQLRFFRPHFDLQSWKTSAIWFKMVGSPKLTGSDLGVAMSSSICIVSSSAAASSLSSGSWFDNRFSLIALKWAWSDVLRTIIDVCEENVSGWCVERMRVLSFTTSITCMHHVHICTNHIYFWRTWGFIQSLSLSFESVPIRFSIVFNLPAVDFTSFGAKFAKKRKNDFALVAWVLVKVDYFSEGNEFGEKLFVVL